MKHALLFRQANQNILASIKTYINKSLKSYNKSGIENYYSKKINSPIILSLIFPYRLQL